MYIYPNLYCLCEWLHRWFFQKYKGTQAGRSTLSLLFVLAMEVFSSLLRSRFDDGYIHYHPKTSNLQVSHLMFVDDVMVFFDGGSSSLHEISEAPDDFASWSGLQMNKNKTHIYVAGLDEREVNLVASFDYPIGNLPIRYLGLPLMSRKLRIAEYEHLFDKLIARFRSWAVKSPSFAGRAHLIISVISGTINFWTSTFMLPKGCLKRIEGLCSRFLWSGCIYGSKGANVSWSGVCLPKKEGGLGFRRLLIWNKALCLKLVWLLFADSGSLWASWHKHHHLRNKSFWDIEESTKNSWMWTMLLRLRPLAERFLKSNVENGLNTHFWHDNWTPLGPLIKLLGEEGPRALFIPLSAKVVDVYTSEGWRLPMHRSEGAMSLHIHLTTVPLLLLASGMNSYCWECDNNSNLVFSTARTWKALRPRQLEKDWYDLIRFKGNFPKHAFNMWVSHLNRLSTR